MSQGITSNTFGQERFVIRETDRRNLYSRIQRPGTGVEFRRWAKRWVQDAMICHPRAHKLPCMSRRIGPTDETSTTTPSVTTSIQHACWQVWKLADFWLSTARNLQRSNVARSASVNFWPEPEYPTLTPTRTCIHNLLNQSPIINIDHVCAQMSDTSIVVSHHLIRLSGDTVLRVGTQDTRAMSRDELQIILQVMRAATFVCPRQPP